MGSSRGTAPSPAAFGSGHETTVDGNDSVRQPFPKPGADSLGFRQRSPIPIGGGGGGNVERFLVRRGAVTPRVHGKETPTSLISVV
ncbi:hypothetical protein CSUB01_07706 [Colletotrichum sublineola]|uniref:Uncharacterized protein n=1 Tax=Colletotrichum sublineola TaxID=1173701 RepID=A0A066X9E3_COLSU|nr:hypothetical protein CSUB01_07706 [Colletotrichum sublineola]